MSNPRRNSRLPKNEQSDMIDDDVEDKEEVDEEVDEEADEEVDADVEDVDVDVEDDDDNQKRKDEDDDDEDEDDDEAADVAPIKKRNHVYHQVPESTEIKIMAPDKRITSEYMTIYEYSMVVGTRAAHIAEGSILYTDPEGLYDPRDIAKKEIAENKCPLSITRQVSVDMMEIWEVNEMIKPLA